MQHINTYITILITVYTHTLHFRHAAEGVEQLATANRLTPRSRFVDWKPVTMEEMEGFFAVILNMGLIQLPELEAYWSTRWTGQIPYFGMVFSRNQF